MIALMLLGLLCLLVAGVPVVIVAWLWILDKADQDVPPETHHKPQDARNEQEW